jgi:hypothetical protein
LPSDGKPHLEFAFLKISYQMGKDKPSDEHFFELRQLSTCHGMNGLIENMERNSVFNSSTSRSGRCKSFHASNMTGI